jgi:hypothetical protein
MQLRMQERRAIVVSRQGGDRVSALQLMAIALVGMCSGLVLVGATTRLREGDRPRQLVLSMQTESSIAAATAWQHAAASSATNSKINVFATAAVGGEASTPARALPAAVGEPPRAGLAHAPEHAGHLERGLVSYLHCDAARRRHHRASCPRDKRLEADVWSALEQLTRCGDADLGRGRAELRLTLHLKGPTEIEFRAAEHGPSLNTRAVSQCTAAQLSELRARLRADQALVVFHFRLA